MFPVIGSRMIMGRSPPVQAQGKRSAPAFGQRRLWLWLRDSYRRVRSYSKADEAVHPRPICFRVRVPIRDAAPADQQEHGRRMMVNRVLTRTERSDCGTTFLGEHGHVSVRWAECSVPAGEQPVQHRRNRLLGILVDPGVIMGSMRPIYPASGLLAQKPERVQLLPGDRHWSCPSSGRVL